MDNLYVLKESGKGMNWGIDYLFLDELKKEFGIKDLKMKRIKSNKGLGRIDRKINSYKSNWVFEEKETIYCMMKYYKNIGDLGKNKEILESKDKLKYLYKIRLFNGLFRSSDNILRNILVSDEKELISIDEGDIFGKRKLIFNKRGDCVKKNLDLELMKICISEIMENKERKIKIISKKLDDFGFESKKNEFLDRFSDFESIVLGELK